MKSIKILLILCLLSSLAVAKKESTQKIEADLNTSVINKTSQLHEIDSKLAKNIWLKRYNDYQSHNKILEEQDNLKSKLSQLKKSDGNEDEILDAQKKLEALKKQLAIYGDTKASLFGELTKVDEISSPKRIDNPLLIFSAVSSIRGFDDKKAQYESRLEEIDSLLEMLKTKKTLLLDIDNNISKIKNGETVDEKNARAEEIQKLLKELTTIKNERDDFETTISIYSQKSSEITQRLKFETKEQLLKLLNIAVVVIALFTISFLIKLGAKKYLQDNHEKSYITKKIIGVITYILVSLTLLLSYIENVSYLVTILGFASAGIAIAMKDWFMSILGWLAIVSTGMIKVGDRIRVNSSDSGDILGDIMDISPLKITLYEDVTMLSYDKHKRSGRIVFIPNNLIFSKLILNYTHNGLLTVWDSITFTITYESDLDRAMEVVKAVVEKQTKTYTRHTDKHMHKLRTNYNIRNYSWEPKIMTFIEPYGISICVWFLTDSYKALSVKSLISKDIFDNIKKEASIQIAYPTSTISFANTARKAEIERLKGE